MSTTAEKIAVMQAYVRGENIQCSAYGSGEWEGWDIGDSPSWSWGKYDYRVKPKPLDCWIVIDCNGDDPIVFYNESKAKECVVAYDGYLPKLTPHRIVHMREVTP